MSELKLEVGKWYLTVENLPVKILSRLVYDDLTKYHGSNDKDYYEHGTVFEEEEYTIKYEITEPKYEVVDSKTEKTEIEKLIAEIESITETWDYIDEGFELPNAQAKIEMFQSLLDLHVRLRDLLKEL